MKRLMKTRAGAWWLTALAAALLNGCATTECDPAGGGYLRGIGCSVSGSYDQRQAERQSQVELERQRQAALESQYRQTQAEQTAVRQEREAAEKRYAALRGDLQRMRNKLAQSKSENRKLKQDIDDLKGQTDLLEKDSFTPEAEKTERLNDLQRRKASLEKQVDIALGR